MTNENLAIGYRWSFQIIDGNRDIAKDANLLKEFHQVCVDGFGLESDDWNTDNISMLLYSTLLGRLFSGSGRLCGIAYYSVTEKQLDGTYLLWEDGICLRKEVQGKRYSLAAIQGAIKMFPSRNFGWLGCRTQIPKMFSRYQKIGKIFPFNEDYNTPIGKRVMEFLLQNISEVQDVEKEKKLNKTNGVCSEIYPQGRLGDYKTGIEGTTEFEKKLEQWNFQRAHGDAVILVARFPQDFFSKNEVSNA
ncbi:MAG TPA: hypothetical protein DD379_26850 [Cyanobacteria bacterium UBA11162]|nr:hypothetical protein [Cyanobacteria bacterium UBA11162]